MVLRKATSEEIDNSSYNPSEGQYLRVSKSSYMGYLMCPRQYWWRYIADIPQPPPTDAMIRGSEIHSCLENAYTKYDGSDFRNLLGGESGDTTLNALAQMEEQRIAFWGDLEVIEAEVKHYLFDEEHEVVIVGMIDGVIRHPDGGIVIVELKTGNMAAGKLTRTRKELCFYYNMLTALGHENITHFMYLTPDCMNEKFLTDMMNSPKKEVYVGEEQGVSMIEKINGRSLSAFAKGYNTIITSLKSRRWDMKWNDYFCPTWCDFNLACDAELTGLCEPMFPEQNEMEMKHNE